MENLQGIAATVIDAWEPFVPSQTSPWDLKKVAHLHRRAGFGASWDELQRDLKDGPDAAVSRLIDPGEESEDLKAVLSTLHQDVLNSADQSDRLPAYWLHRMLFHPHQLQEKMTLFWHSHFATSNDKVHNESLMLQQNELLRHHALGDLSSMLDSVLTDPAMLIWLDGANSPKEKPNENLGREFLELFTLGVGHYTEFDIREVARAFTGWKQEARFYGSAKIAFDSEKFDERTKRFLGQSGPWTREDIIRITLEQPACAQLLCRKLYRHFINEHREPSPEMIETLAREFRSQDYSIRHVMGILLRSKHFYQDANRRQRIASPIELSVGLLRALDIPPQDVRLIPLAEACRWQGQQLFYPPNVAGWPGGRNWITSTNMIERTNWLSDVIWGHPDNEVPPFDPLAWRDRNRIPAGDAGRVLIDLLLQGELSLEARKVVLEVAAPGDAISLQKATQLLVHCPEYQLV
jgi:uncharacterized protein (DUF1800 family)